MTANFPEMRMISWSRLRRWGKNRAVRSSYVWIILVPLAARLSNTLDGMPKIFESNSGGGVPLSWELGYFAAVSFSIGAAVYQIWCPSLIREYRDFAEFRSAGNGHLALVRWIMATWTDETRRRQIASLLVNSYGTTASQAEISARLRGGMVQVEQCAEKIRFDDDGLGEAFIWVRHEAEKRSPVARILVALLMAIGSTCGAIVLSQGFRQVWVAFSSRH